MEKEDLKNILILFNIFYDDIKLGKKLKEKFKKEFIRTYERIKMNANYTILSKKNQYAEIRKKLIGIMEVLQ